MHGVQAINKNPFLDSYIIEFLDLPSPYKENDFRKALILKMRDFILELGKDFTFIDEEYKLQLPGKKVLQEKLQELVNIPEVEAEGIVSPLVTQFRTIRRVSIETKSIPTGKSPDS